MRRQNTLRIAMFDPVGDVGIGGYTHELATGLAAIGCEVHLYTHRRALALTLPHAYRALGVLGRPLFMQRGVWANADSPVPPGALPPWWRRLPRVIQRGILATEFVAFLRAQRYDVLWTQWPRFGTQARSPSWLKRATGVPLVHTVHNVLPHESEPDDQRVHQTLYRDADALVVHSAGAAADLAERFPAARGRIIESRHGLYTQYARAPHARDRLRAALELPDEATAVLFFGGVRPYKNVDAFLDALATLRDPRIIGVIAGWEWGYQDIVPGDALGRTRQRVRQLDIEPFVRLLPGPIPQPLTPPLFEASDVVILPYTESSGSGQLLLAMTFEKHVVASPAGGMHEYLETYPRHTRLERTDARAIGDALSYAHRHWRERSSLAAAQDVLAWPTIARRLCADLASLGLVGPVGRRAVHDASTELLDQDLAAVAGGQDRPDPLDVPLALHLPDASR